MSDTRELFRALEFAHYAERFRGARFVLALPAGVPFSDLLLDIKVCKEYRIGLVLVTRDVDYSLEPVISRANKRGAEFQLSLVTDLVFNQERRELNLDFRRIEEALTRGRIPVIACHAEPGSAPAAADGGMEDDPVFALAAVVAERIHTSKLFMVHALAEPLKRQLPQGSVQAAEMDALVDTLEPAHVPALQGLFRYIRERLKAGIPDVVLISGETGELFREVFTYDGAGVLFNAQVRSAIRNAGMRDVTDIALLLRPEIESGRILPCTENQIEESIYNYWIYEIDGMPVGLACLKNYGEAAELSQFSTLPRYRGKGRARELARFLIAKAAELGYRTVFALSIDERMWEFFLSLGFRLVEREELPESWRRDYDMSRASRAFLLPLPHPAQ